MGDKHIDDVQDMVIAQRGALVAVLSLIHGLAPDRYSEMVRGYRLYVQRPRENPDPRDSHIDQLLLGILEDGEKMPPLPTGVFH